MESPASPCPTLPLSSCPQERLRSKVQDKSPDSPQGLASSLSPSPWDPVLARHTLPPPHNDCSVWPTPQNKNEIFSNFRGNEENSDSPRPASPFTSPRAVYQSDNRGPQARRFAYSSIQHTPEHSLAWDWRVSDTILGQNKLAAQAPAHINTMSSTCIR